MSNELVLIAKVLSYKPWSMSIKASYFAKILILHGMVQSLYSFKWELW
jgi:hypothetical protein